MADKTFDAEELKKLLKLAKAEPLPFAFGLAAKAEDSVLVLHKKKTGKQLFMMVKNEFGHAKGTWGTIAVDGKIASFTCEKRVPSLKKILDKLLKAKTLPYKSEVLDAGAAVEEDEEEVVEEVVEEEESAEEVARIFSDEQLLTLLKLCKSRGDALPFAFCLGGAPGEHRLVLHKKKKAKPLFALLRKSFAELGKGTWGEASVDGKIVTLKCEKPLPSMRRHVLGMFKAKSLPFKVSILGPDGAEIVEPDDEVGADEAVTEPKPDDALRKQIMTTLNKLTPAIKAIVAEQPERKAELLQPIAAIQKDLAAGEIASARASLLAVGNLVKELRGAAAAAAGPETATATAEPEVAEEAFDGTVTIEVLDIWSKARKQAEKEIVKLQRAVMQAFPDGRKQASELGHVLDDVDGGLSKELANAAKVSDPAEGAKARERITGLIETNAREIASSRMLEHVEGNPFVQIDVRARLAEALDEMMARVAS